MKRSGKIVVVAHCLLNVHSLEDAREEYRGLEEDLLAILMAKGVGLFQFPCLEIDLHGIFRKPLPKDSYDHPKIRSHYSRLDSEIAR